MNDEIEEAFRQGKLKSRREGFPDKTGRQQECGGNFNLWPYMVNTLRGSILLDSYKVTMKPSIDSNSGTFKKHRILRMKIFLLLLIRLIRNNSGIIEKLPTESQNSFSGFIES